MIKRLTPAERLKQQESAYASMLNLQPAQEKKQSLERGKVAEGTLTEMIKGFGADESDSEERGRVKGTLEQGSQMLGEVQAKQAKEQDALSFQGANQRESIISQRQSAATSDFVRESEAQTKALQEAVAQRAIDLGMNSQELTFHNNALVADTGFDKLKTDFAEGRVNKQELITLKENLTLRAQKRNNAAEEMLAIRFNEAMLLIQKGDIANAKKVLEIALKAQKDAADDMARASNLGTIIGGGAQLFSSVFTK